MEWEEARWELSIALNMLRRRRWRRGGDRWLLRRSTSGGCTLVDGGDGGERHDPHWAPKVACHWPEKVEEAELESAE